MRRKKAERKAKKAKTKVWPSKALCFLEVLRFLFFFVLLPLLSDVHVQASVLRCLSVLCRRLNLILQSPKSRPRALGHSHWLHPARTVWISTQASLQEEEPPKVKPEDSTSEQVSCKQEGSLPKEFWRCEIM